jgi:hypothetical protein
MIRLARYPAISSIQAIEKQVRRALEHIGTLTTRYDVELTGFSDASRPRNCHARQSIHEEKQRQYILVRLHGKREASGGKP